MALSDLFKNGNKPNIVIIMCDQQRWDPTFADAHLPALKSLRQNGITFNEAMTSACMCSPSRAALLTSQYPACTGVTLTGNPEPKYPLSTTWTNLATVLKKANYSVSIWNGKWHLGNLDANGLLDNFGFALWDPADAGNSLQVDNSLGGGTPQNDARYLYDLENNIKALDITKPFCLVASFVNPHDVFCAQTAGAIPTSSGGSAGTNASGYAYETTQTQLIALPANATNTGLATAARAHAANPFNPNAGFSQQEYLNFYTYLQTQTDNNLQALLTALRNRGQNLINNTLIIYLSDHGELGASHNLVEKMYNVYEETLNIPLVFSNPIAWPSAVSTNALATHVDLLPTLASLLGVYNDFKAGTFIGVDLSPVLNGTQSYVQEYVHFTYDDHPCSSPSIVRAVRDEAWTYAVYCDVNGKDADWELFNRKTDPGQVNNLAGQSQYATAQARMEQMLVTAMTKAATAPNGFQWPPQATGSSRGV
jgi:arylsulfatase A-like enzyme